MERIDEVRQRINETIAQYYDGVISANTMAEIVSYLINFEILQKSIDSVESE